MCVSDAIAEHVRSEVAAFVSNINTLRPRQNGRHFADDIFKYNFRNGDVKFLSQGSNWQLSSIGSDKGLAPTRRQAIIWNNVG